MNSIYEKLEIPERDIYTSITKEEGEYIYQLLKDKNLKNTLEVGFAYGCSAAYILTATKSLHYAMDPFQEQYNNLGLKNIKRLILDKYLKFEKDFSHNVLPELLKKNVKIDFAFIDGDHKFDSIFVDFYYIDLLLNNNGYVLFHDTWMRTTQHILSWIKNNKKNYTFIKTPIKNIVLIQKIKQDNRNWHHFKSFYTFKSLITHILFNFSYEKHRFEKIFLLSSIFALSETLFVRIIKKYKNK